MSIVQILQIPLKTGETLNQQAWKDLLASFKQVDDVTASLWAPKHEDGKVGGIAIGTPLLLSLVRYD